MAGVGVATAAIVCVLSVFNGFSDLAVGLLSAIDPQLKVVPAKGKTIASADSLAAVLTTLDMVDKAVATIEENALAMNRGAQMAVRLRGVPAGYNSVVNIESTIIDGEFLTGNENLPPMATLSVGPAVKLNLHPNDFNLLELYVPTRTGRINPANPMGAFHVDSMMVGGVMQLADNERDANTIIAPIENVRELLEYTDEATALDIKLKPGISDTDAKTSIEKILGPDYIVQTMLEQEAQSFKMISVEKWITFLMLAFILIIASFNVLSTLSMIIIEKQENMTTLRALGAPMGMIRRIYFWEGCLISAIGGVCGMALGVGLCLSQQAGGFIKLNGDPSALIVSAYPVRVEWSDLAIVALLVAVVGVLIGAITSRLVRKS